MTAVYVFANMARDMSTSRVVQTTKDSVSTYSILSQHQITPVYGPGGDDLEVIIMYDQTVDGVAEHILSVLEGGRVKGESVAALNSYVPAPTVPTTPTHVEGPMATVMVKERPWDGMSEATDLTHLAYRTSLSPSAVVSVLQSNGIECVQGAEPHHIDIYVDYGDATAFMTSLRRGDILPPATI